MKKVLVFILLLALAGPSSAFAGKFGGGGGGGFKSSGGGSKSSGGYSGGSKSSSSSKPAFSVAKPTIYKPSTGPKQQPLPTPRLIPATPPVRSFPKAGTKPPSYQPVGRNYANDRNILIRNPQYVNPYGPSYYGAFDSPFYYIWLYSMLDDDRSNNPQPPQADEGKIAPIIPSELGVVSALIEEVNNK